MKILITGGAGYIGYSLVNKLDQNERVEEITVFDNLYKFNVNFFTTGRRLQKTKFVKGDLLNKYDLEKVVKNRDIVIHLAGHVEHPYSYKDNYKYEQINQYGTLVLYDLLKENPPQKIIFLSSAAVYGFKEVENEQTPTEPTNYYGISKREAEKYVQLLKNDSAVFLLRSGNVFGFNPQVRLDSVINHFIFDALIYNRIRIYGNGNQKRPFIGLHELINKIETFSIGDEQGGIYNLSQANLALNEIRDFIKSQLGDIEFTYADSHKELPSIEMKSSKIGFEKDIKTSLPEEFEQFQDNLRLMN